MASSISFKAYNSVYMFFRAKISTADLSIQPPIQSAFLQETKIYHKFPETRTTTPLATSAKTGQKPVFHSLSSWWHQAITFLGKQRVQDFTPAVCFFLFLFFPAPTSQAAWFEALCVVLLAALTSKTSGLTALQSSKEKPCCIQQNQQSSAWCQSPGQR